MSDQLKAILDSVPGSNRMRAAAWDAFYNAPDADQAGRLMDRLGVPPDARMRIVELKAREAAQQAGPGAGERFLSNLGAQINPVTAVKGLASAVADPKAALSGIYNASADQAGKAAAAFGEGRYGEAIGHGLGAVPIIGPAAAAAGEQIASGDVAGGLGTGAGLVLGAGLAGPAGRVVGRTVRPVAQRAAEGLYQSALKPTKSVLKDVRTPAGAGPDAARQMLVRTGLEERIPISPAGQRKVGNLIDSLNTEVQARLSSAEQAGKTVDPAFVERQIREVADDFTNQINAQPDLATIDTVRQNFLTNPNVSQPVLPAQAGQAATHAPGPIPIRTAQEMKTNTYRGLRGKYGTERTATIEAEKAGARGLREQIETQAGDEIGALNAREGSMIPLEEAVADAMRRRGNYGIFGLTPIVASVPAVAHGNLWPLLAAMVDRMPGIVSRTGIWINRTGQRSGRLSQEATRATVAGNVTSPSESQRRTTAPGLLTPLPVR